MPYEEHPYLNTPPDDTTIWRYMTLAKLLSLLASECLHFSRADQLGDPFEGSALPNSTYMVVTTDASTGTQTYLETPHEALPEGMRKVEAQGRKAITKSTYISCWYARPHESAAMWTLYGSTTEGAAIRSTVGRLKRSIAKSKEVVRIGQVQYRDFAALNTDYERNAYMAFVRKRISFEHEQEVRALFTRFVDRGEIQPLGWNVATDLSVLVEAIVIAPQAEPWFADVVKEVTSLYGAPVVPTFSPLSDEPYWGE